MGNKGCVVKPESLCFVTEIECFQNSSLREDVQVHHRVIATSKLAATWKRSVERSRVIVIKEEAGLCKYCQFVNGPYKLYSHDLFMLTKLKAALYT